MSGKEGRIESRNLFYELASSRVYRMPKSGHRADPSLSPIQSSSILVTRLHASHLDSRTLSASSSASTPYASADLFERLIRLGNGWWWRVGMLGSGRSGVVMGEVSFARRVEMRIPLPTDGPMRGNRSLRTLCCRYRHQRRQVRYRDRRHVYRGIIRCSIEYMRVAWRCLPRVRGKGSYEESDGRKLWDWGFEGLEEEDCSIML
jgi:hypothetical protein